MHRLFATVSGLILLVSHAPLADAGEAVDLPFDHRNGLIWIDVQINGQSKPFHFLLDSGAEQSVIHLSLAGKLGIELDSPLSVGRVHGVVPSFETAPTTIRLATGVEWSGSLLALDLSADSRRVRGSIDGLLGMDFLAGKVVRIDYRSKRIRLNPSRLSHFAASVPIAQHRGTPCVALTIDGVLALPRVRIDTGCNEALHWSRVPGDSGQAGQAFSRRSRTVDVTLGGSRIENIGTTFRQNPLFAGEQGLLGNRLLARFGVVTLDFARQRLILG